MSNAYRFLARWEDPSSRALFELGCWYHLRAEEYDLAVCGGRRRGVAIPVTSVERQLVSENARRLLRILDEAFAQLGIPPERRREALHHASRPLDLDDLRQMVARMGEDASRALDLALQRRWTDPPSAGLAFPITRRKP